VRREIGELEVNFDLTDLNSQLTVAYNGILPDLFREGQGIVVQGRLDPSGVFYADEVLAKHDENYMPPELMDMAAEAKSAKQAQGAIEAQDLKVNPASDVYRPAAESQATVSGDYSDGGGR
jgi:cytochrome c-type biogenesis protein CcmE